LTESCHNRFLHITGLEKLDVNSNGTNSLAVNHSPHSPQSPAGAALQDFKAEISYKNQLQELLQSRYQSIQAKYEIASIDGPHHQPCYTMKCSVLGNTTLGIAPSKRTAEQKAAFLMLQKFRS